MLRSPGFLSTRTLFQLSRPILGRANKPRIQWRNASTHASRSNTKRRNLLGVVSGGALLAVGLSPFYASSIYADAAVSDESSELTLGALIRYYVVYTMCSIPVLVDNSPRLLQFATLPGINWIAETFVRITFFDQVSVTTCRHH